MFVRDLKGMRKKLWNLARADREGGRTDSNEHTTAHPDQKKIRNMKKKGTPTPAYEGKIEKKKYDTRYMLDHMILFLSFYSLVETVGWYYV